MRSIIATFFCSLLFFGLKAQTVAPPVQKDPAKVLSFINAEYEMGKIAVGKPLEYNVTIKNISKDTIILKEVKAGCGCTTPKYRTNETILPGKSTFITLGFNGGANGEFTKFADIYFSDGYYKQVKFHGVALADSTAPKIAVNR